MPKCCCVYKCTATNGNELGKNRSFHAFPSNANLRKAWIRKVGRQDFKPTYTSFVCSYHFCKEDFSTKKNDTPIQFRKSNLKKGSIPSHNLRGETEDTRVAKRWTLISKSCEQSSPDVVDAAHPANPTLPYGDTESINAAFIKKIEELEKKDTLSQGTAKMSAKGKQIKMESNFDNDIFINTNSKSVGIGTREFVVICDFCCQVGKSYLENGDVS